MGLIYHFLNLSLQDPRVGPSHISLYIALVQILEENKGEQPILIKRDQVMPLARINASSTYHKVLADLVEGGYLKYHPGFNRKGSKVFFRMKEI